MPFYTSEQRHEHYLKNRDKILKGMKIYREINKELLNVKQVQRRKDHPEKIKFANKRQNQKRKQSLLDYCGTSCCEQCGYSVCIEALDFHHINPLEKDMNLHKKSLSVLVKAELDKCVVLCSNCHREVHAGYRKILHINVSYGV